MSTKIVLVSYDHLKGSRIDCKWDILKRGMGDLGPVPNMNTVLKSCFITFYSWDKVGYTLQELQFGSKIRLGRPHSQFVPHNNNSTVSIWIYQLLPIKATVHSPFSKYWNFDYKLMTMIKIKSQSLLEYAKMTVFIYKHFID